jgi:glutamate-5-semialdehyde dehydrogenase
VAYKYVLKSQGEDGHIVGEFGQEPGKKQYTHQPIEAKELPFLNRRKYTSWESDSTV